MWIATVPIVLIDWSEVAASAAAEATGGTHRRNTR
jgi:hypothetical protein